MQALEQLRIRFEEEGVFDPERKQDLPAFPACIGVVTSAAGAAIQAITKVLEDRDAPVRLLLSPALVQGTEAKHPGGHLSFRTHLVLIHRRQEMPSYVIPDKCDGCKALDTTACQHICPNDLMVLNKETMKAFNQDPAMCWECYSCVKICPTDAIEFVDAKSRIAGQVVVGDRRRAALFERYRIAGVIVDMISSDNCD